MKKIKLLSGVLFALSAICALSFLPKDNLASGETSPTNYKFSTRLDYTDHDLSGKIDESHMTNQTWTDYKNWTYFGGVTNMENSTQLDYLKMGSKEIGSSLRAVSATSPYTQRNEANRVEVTFTGKDMADGMSASDFYVEVFSTGASGSQSIDKTVLPNSNLPTSFSEDFTLTFQPSTEYGKTVWEGNNLRFAVGFIGTNESDVDGIMHLKKIEFFMDTTIKVSDFRIWDIGHVVNPGDEIDLEYNIYPSNATNQTINWTSTNENIVTVDNKGHVTVMASASDEKVKVIGTTADGSFQDSCWFSINQNVTKLENVKFGSGFDLTNKYYSIVYINKVIEFNSKTYFVVNDDTGSLLLTPSSLCVGAPIEGKVYKVYYSCSHTYNTLYAGSLNYFEEASGVELSGLSTVNKYANISTNPVTPQFVNIFASKVSGTVVDSSLNKVFYRVGEKEIVLNDIEVCNPITEDTANCELGQYLTLNGILLPFATNKTEYRYIFVANDKNVLASYFISFYLYTPNQSPATTLLETRKVIVGEQVLPPSVTLESHQYLTPWVTDLINPTVYDFDAIPEAGTSINLFSQIESTASDILVKFIVDNRVYSTAKGLDDGSFKVVPPETNPVSNTQIFRGWSTVTGNESHIVDFTEDVIVREHTSYYAIFSDPCEVTVTFMDDMSEEVLFTTTTLEGRPISSYPSTPLREGKIFDHWSCELSGGESRYDYDDIITKDTTLYTRFRDRNKYRVQFKLINGTTFDPFFVQEGDYIPQDKIPDVNKILGSEFNFLYWRVIETSWNRKFFIESETVKENLTLLAITESPDKFLNNEVMSQLYLNYTKNVADDNTTYSLLSASIHIGLRMKFSDLLDANSGDIGILYGTNKTFANADNETEKNFTDFSSRLDSLYQANLVDDYKGELGYGYSNLGLRYKPVNIAMVDGYGNEDDNGEYVQFGITISNINLDNLDTKIFVAIYTSFGYGLDKHNAYLINSETGMSLRDICLRYITMPNASEVLGDHYGVIEYLANYNSSND